ncbi:autotransporter outer membrane beta-barrel domain-containing protein [Entomomonas sp. E2T0]|uniref:autotransporter family protein n=1 Tax=Entomomonas sp. E2T0 TaxID=2930213 RepID=UPI0022282422|nr:autotransporter outer membrane beta-barrel domain-containing protein [Entomomonas sp. E2T0]UYZ84694.1 autotransporter outer membrane beta-barrel domain-containing protein [Entomomonas sp. E2T0]
MFTKKYWSLVNFSISFVGLISYPLLSYAAAPTSSLSPDGTVITYEGGDTNASIKASDGALTKMVVKGVTIEGQNWVNVGRYRSWISFGGVNGNLGYSPNYGDLEIEVDKDTRIISSVSSNYGSSAIYTRTDGQGKTAKITTGATVNLTNLTNQTVAVLVEAFNGTAVLSLTEDSNINVSGTKVNIGARVDANNGTAIVNNAGLINITGGDNSSGLLVIGKTNYIENSGNINVFGQNSIAIDSTASAGDNIINITGGSIKGASGTNSAGLKLTTTDGKTHISNYGQISSDNDLAILSQTTGGESIVDNGGTIVGYSTISGSDVVFNNQGGTLDLQNFSSGSKATIVNTIGTTNGIFNNAGIIKFSNRNLDGTTSHAVFDVATFNNAGTINLTNKNPLGDNALIGDTLTINGNYVSNGGSLYLNTLLDDGSSNGGQGTSDLLIVNGDVITGTGATKVFITPTAPSLGQLTTGDGIKVVEVQGSSSSNAFALGKPLTSGAYEYLLNKGTTNENWYLTSFYNPYGGGSGGQVIYNPAIGAYLANQTAATEMFQQSLYDRLVSANDFDNDASKRLFWLRAKVSHSSYRSVHSNFSNRNRTYMMQMGGDLALLNINDGYLHLGVMAGYGDFENTTTSRLTRTKVDGKVKGYSAGVYGTWFENQDTDLGLYIDTWSQLAWYRNEVSGESQVATKRYSSNLLSNSVEVGYGIPLGTTSDYQVIMTPQLQLTYNLYDADNLRDKNNLYVTANKASGLTSRSGIRMSARGVTQKTVEPFVEVNYINSTAKNQLKFNGDSQHDGTPRSRLETKIGLQGSINDSWSVAAHMGGEWGSNNFERYTGQLNVNYHW